MGNIVWLASYPKSGNTWLRAFIYNLIENPGRPGPIEALPDYFESESKPRWYIPYLDKTDLAETSFDEMIALRPKVHQDIANSVPRGSVFTKTHNQFTHYNDVPLHNMSVTAAAIYIVRNPLDVLLSTADHFGLSLDAAIDFMGNVKTGSLSNPENVATFLGSWSNHVESWTINPHQQFVVLRYEDMLDQPLRAFTRVAKLLGLNKDKSRIKQAISFSSFQELKKQELKSGFVERSPDSKAFFRKGQKNQWVNSLNDDQVTRMIDHHRDQMARFGYIPPKYR
jgi:hypothetical protein